MPVQSTVPFTASACDREGERPRKGSREGEADEKVEDGMPRGGREGRRPKRGLYAAGALCCEYVSRPYCSSSDTRCCACAEAVATRRNRRTQTHKRTYHASVVLAHVVCCVPHRQEEVLLLLHQCLPCRPHDWEVVVALQASVHQVDLRVVWRKRGCKPTTGVGRKTAIDARKHRHTQTHGHAATGKATAAPFCR